MPVSHLLRALETFQALGIEFVSLNEQVDISMPMGKMVSTVLGAVAELELTYSRASACGASECARQGQDPRQAARDRGPLQDCEAAGGRALLGEDRGESNSR